MKKINHVDMVAQLAKPGADVIAGLTPLSAHLLHMAVGVSGEVSELIENFLDNGSRENQIEEFGDIEFYYEGIVPHLNFEHGFDAVVPEYFSNNLSVEREILTLAKHCGALLDAIKKSAIYVKGLDVSETVEQMINIRVSLCNLYFITGITRDAAIEANINKLGIRYLGHNYSDAQAQDRADK